MPFETHEAYFKSCPPAVQQMLLAIQAQVEARVPEGQRCIAYHMPAFKTHRVFFYFAAFKKHIGVYPPVQDDAELLAELAPYRGAKGNLSFPLTQELPIELIGRVAVALHRQYAR